MACEAAPDAPQAGGFEQAVGVARNGAAATGSADALGALTAYELERLENMKRNSAALAALNLPALGAPAAKQGTPRKKRAKPEEPEEPPRRTGRASNTPQFFSPLEMDSDEEEAEGGGEEVRKRKRRYHTAHVSGLPEARPGAGIQPELRASLAAAGDAAAGDAPAPLPAAAPDAPVVRPSSGKVRCSDGLQARYGGVMLLAGSALLHPHEQSGLAHILTVPPYYAPHKLAELLDRVREAGKRQVPPGNKGDPPSYMCGKWVAANMKVSKAVANAVVRFLSRARVINGHPGLASLRTRGGSTELLDEASQAAEAAIAAGTLRRRVLSAAEAPPLPPGVFVTTGRSVRLVSNKAGFKGVRPARGVKGSWVAELFDGPTRYTVGTYASAAEAAEAYDRAVLRVRPVTQASQLNFPLQRYVAEGLVADSAGAAAAPAAQPTPTADASQLCAADDDSAPPEEEAAGAGEEEEPTAC